MRPLNRVLPQPAAHPHAPDALSATQPSTARFSAAFDTVPPPHTQHLSLAVCPPLLYPSPYSSHRPATASYHPQPSPAASRHPSSEAQPLSPPPHAQHAVSAVMPSRPNPCP